MSANYYQAVVICERCGAQYGFGGTVAGQYSVRCDCGGTASAQLGNTAPLGTTPGNGPSMNAPLTKPKPKRRFYGPAAYDARKRDWWNRA